MSWKGSFSMPMTKSTAKKRRLRSCANKLKNFKRRLTTWRISLEAKGKIVRSSFSSFTRPSRLQKKTPYSTRWRLETTKINSKVTSRSRRSRATKLRKSLKRWRSNSPRRKVSWTPSWDRFKTNCMSYSKTLREEAWSGLLRAVPAFLRETSRHYEALSTRARVQTRCFKTSWTTWCKYIQATTSNARPT